ncbi:MAG: Mov34/MPN/PAD-1 family protein [Candidatus Margulisiibacteriota bacterium]
MFTITERQYNIILRQAEACFPQETGGILGGRENTILGVLPIPNKHLYDRTQIFAMTQDDIDTAYHFLVKHKLEYLGVYHTHPKGIPFPSAQDLSYNQKYLFIIGLQDRYNPELYAWKIEDGKVYSEDIKIMSDAGITVVDIKTGKPKLSENVSKVEMDRIAQIIDDMIAGRETTYPKLETNKWDAASFNTFA